MPSLALLSLMLMQATAGEGQVAPAFVSLDEAVNAALARNFEVRMQRYDEAIAMDGVEVSRSRFDTVVGADSSWRGSSADGTEGSPARQQAGVAATRRLSTGALMSLQTRYTRSGAEERTAALGDEGASRNGHRAVVSASLRQPLLRDRGSQVNFSGVRQAEMRVEIARLQLQLQIQDVLSRVEKAYWSLSYARARHALRVSGYELSRTLLRETEERSSVGRATSLDVLQARANLASYQESILESERQIRDAEDALADLIGDLNPDGFFDGYLVQPLREIAGEIPDVSRLWKGAWEHSLDLSVQRASLDVFGEDRLQARNALKTDLNLLASASTLGYSYGGFDDAYSAALDREGYDWEVGLEVSIPIGRRASKAELRQADARLERESLRLERLEQQLFRQVREQQRRLAVGVEKLKAVRLTLALEEEAFAQQKLRVDIGLAGFRDLQESQAAVDRARISELDAWLSVLGAEIDVGVLEGSLLRRHGIGE